MRPTSDISGMYRSFPAYLWVEDEETRTYLETAWSGESLIKLYVAGGARHVGAVVKAAREDWNTHVFGLRDRDFADSNRNRWSEPDVHVFAGDSLEVENLMLDAEAIADCDVNTSGLGSAAVEERMVALASPQISWMACRRLISEISEAATRNFVEHPRRANIRSHAEALNAITGSEWWRHVLPTLPATWGNSQDIGTKLTAHEAGYASALRDRSWREKFSGKEILRDLRSAVWTKKHEPDPGGAQTFVRAIAAAQVRLGRVPDEVNTLRRVIRHRIGRAP